MNNLEKMKKGELKDLFIKKIVEVETLFAWYDEHNIRHLIGSLIIDSNYLENRSYINPKDVGHKFMDKAIYSNEITKLQKLINQLEEVRIEFEKGDLIQIDDENGNQNQSKEILTEGLDNSNLNQINDVLETEKGDSIQKNNNEKNNQIQSKRGGKREGAGRKGFGVTKKVSVTLPSEVWGEIEEICEKGNLNQSKVLRELIQKGLLIDRN
ncbi:MULTISPECIES: ribbon-helix-helix protein, CopG family [Bacillus cereus group]|uniref:ribbon-helix-helix protein, CopG family n=1 Tax=Bacillus cereus group TaxID=86661 RepID=UPI001CC22214|nr:ribbon-helix-helix protein, CopG family [Bacillus cereus]